MKLEHSGPGGLEPFYRRKTVYDGVFFMFVCFHLLDFLINYLFPFVNSITRFFIVSFSIPITC